MTFIENYVARKALDAAIKLAATCLTNVKSGLLTSTDSLAAAIERHLLEVKNWAAEVNFGDLKEPKPTHRIFVQLDCYVVPRHRRVSSNEQLERVPLDALFEGDTKHFVFLGTPGAGKTTSMKHLCSRIFTDSSFAPDRINFPIVIKLRDLNQKKEAGRMALLNELCAVLGLQFQFAEVLDGRSSDEAFRVRAQVLSDAACSILNETKALLILDGFDEITEYDLRQAVISDVRQLALRLETSTMVLTSRTGEFLAVIDSAKIYEICPLGAEQIADFAGKWLASEVRANCFIEQVRNSPFADSAIKPLTLAHLCAVFERVGSIPEKPKTVYRKILHLLLVDWDEQRSVRRISRYSGFEPDRKYEFLSNLAYHLTVEEKAVVFCSPQIAGVYRRICGDLGLPHDQAREVAKEVESHTGLFVQCGFDQFEFAHKSLQEFLAAEFLVRLPSIPESRSVLLKLPNELAIATAISSNPSLYLTELVLRRFLDLRAPQQFFTTFVTRLLQERPDFNAQAAVTLALLCLYSLTLEDYAARGDQLPLFLYDVLIEEFEKLFAAVLRNNSPAEVSGFYQDAGAARVSSKHSIHVLRKVHELKGYELPPHLYVRQTFLGQIFGTETRDRISTASEPRPRLAL